MDWNIVKLTVLVILVLFVYSLFADVYIWVD